MKPKRIWIALSFLVTASVAAQPQPPQQRPQRPPEPPPLQPTPEDLAPIRAKVDELAGLVAALKQRHEDPDVVADVEVHEKAGRWLLEFPDEIFTKDGLAHALSVLDTGIDRARKLQEHATPWLAGPRRTHGYVSALDGSVQPYGVRVPDSYDGTKPTRLYVWLHGRAQRLTEADFLYSFAKQGAGKPPVAEVGQLQLDVYGRWNGAGYHYAGEVDVFEALAAVMKRYNVDPKRILLRGFSMGGEGAWHIAFHNPDRWAAAEIGAGTWSRRALNPGYPPHQQAVLRIWENIPEWALNVFNMPLAGHDGENDGFQLESSIKAREQLAKEGFPSEGDKYDMTTKGVPAIFLASKATGHGTSPEVRQRLDAFLKEHGDRGQSSPDHVRFLTYTTRYNRDFWVTLDALDKHYERADIDATRSEDGARYTITTHNLARLTLRETDHARTVRIDGRDLRVKPAPSLVLDKTRAGWRVARAQWPGLHKTHALQGPIDDAFLDPFLCVRPTGTPWNEAVNQQALRALARFDRLYARFLRAHPRIVDDKDVTLADFARYNVVLFGDPGSNKWIARVLPRLPVRWTRESVSVGAQKLPSAQHLPALVYPSPLGAGRYVVLNSGITAEDRDYRGDYALPRLGDYAVLQVKEGADVPDVAYAGLFDESWRVPSAR